MLVLLAALLGMVADRPARVADPLPFGPGEELAFQVHSSRFGRIGTAVMRVSADTIRGREAWLLGFDFSAKVILFHASDQTRSWVDPATLSALRYSKRERSPMVKRDESVEIFPEEQRWTTRDGSFDSPTTDPLDELSFLYYLRTLPLDEGAEYRVERHFDAARNPVLIRVLGREPITDPAGVYQTILVEMRVRDSRQDKGYSVLRLHLTDNSLRVPVRIESSMPFGGTLTMRLQSRLVTTSDF